MSNDKYKEKIKKLLALAQSDNPHEAERARVQAEKLMAKHNINTDDIEIITVTADRPILRRNMRTSEAFLLDAILKVSGCYIYTSSCRCANGRYVTTLKFMGLEPDARLAAYSWEVLFSQLHVVQCEMKSKYRLNVGEVEHYSRAWVQSASKKIKTVFGHKKTSEKLDRFYKKKTSDWGQTGLSKTNRPDDNVRANELVKRGLSDGSNARLNNVADTQDKQARLSAH